MSFIFSIFYYSAMEHAVQYVLILLVLCTFTQNDALVFINLKLLDLLLAFPSPKFILRVHKALITFAIYLQYIFIHTYVHVCAGISASVIKVVFYGKLDERPP